MIRVRLAVRENRPVAAMQPIAILANGTLAGRLRVVVSSPAATIVIGTGALYGLYWIPVRRPAVIGLAGAAREPGAKRANSPVSHSS